MIPSSDPNSKTPILDDLRKRAVRAYEAYGRKVDFKNFRGEPMPIFDELPEKIQRAWIEVVRQVGQDYGVPGARREPEE